MHRQNDWEDDDNDDEVDDEDLKKRRANRLRYRKKDKKKEWDEPRIKGPRQNSPRVRINPNDYDEFDDIEEMFYFTN